MAAQNQPNSEGVISYIFDGTKAIRDLTGYALFRGVTDWSNLKQFNNFESGYSLLILISIPKFLKELAEKSIPYGMLIKTYQHVLEYEFRGLDGLDNMTSETAELTNGVKSINVINKVNSQSGGTFSMRYYEKSGSIMTKVHELFLRGIKDPTTQVKHYNGLIDAGLIEPGFEQEVFSFLYIVTDNTMLNVEKAFFIVAAQPTNADFNIYNTERGDIQFKELTLEFNGFPITNTQINLRAQQLLTWVRKNTIWDESQFQYEMAQNDKLRPYNDVLVGNGAGNTGKQVKFTG